MVRPFYSEVTHSGEIESRTLRVADNWQWTPINLFIIPIVCSKVHVKMREMKEIKDVAFSEVFSRLAQ